MLVSVITYGFLGEKLAMLVVDYLMLIDVRRRSIWTLDGTISRAGVYGAKKIQEVSQAAIARMLSCIPHCLCLMDAMWPAVVSGSRCCDDGLQLLWS